jgi:dihydrofolate synthase/folylpolyglutamate synthase
MQPKTLTEWLDWQAHVHPKDIELSLDRCRCVAERMNLLHVTFPILTVAGTNGKGSSVTLLESILRAAGYKTGRYMSPHILRYNERVCINGMPVSDIQLCEAFTEIETVRGDISLTVFEYGTLAAMWLFRQHAVDVAVLEVGLGGRLDATNIWHPHVALVTPIGLDHTAWLGETREQIGFEKAGIFREQHPAVCTDLDAPHSLIAHAKNLNCTLYLAGRDFQWHRIDEQTWQWSTVSETKHFLPVPCLLGEYQLQNAAGVLQVLACVTDSLPVSLDAIKYGLQNMQLAGRFQIISGAVTRILDVTHNPLGIQVFKQQLQQLPCAGKTHAVVGILQEKDMAGILEPLMSCVDTWHIANLNTPRNTPVALLEDMLYRLGVNSVSIYANIATAYEQVCLHAQTGDRVLVFGSFYTVMEALQVEEAQRIA